VWPELPILLVLLLPVSTVFTVFTTILVVFFIFTGHWWNLWLALTEPFRSVEPRLKTTASQHQCAQV